MKNWKEKSIHFTIYFLLHHKINIYNIYTYLIHITKVKAHTYIYTEWKVNNKNKLYTSWTIKMFDKLIQL